MAALTPADLVVLSVLTERPMHGYELNRVLESRDVQDWAGVSRPQVYYSLKKLAALGYITEVSPRRGKAAADTVSQGPERSTYASSAAGRRALATALAREDWATQRPPPPFLTWMALSTHASRDVVRRQLERRRAFLEAQIAREKETLESIRADTGEMVQVGALMVTLAIRHFEAELSWLSEVERELGYGRRGRRSCRADSSVRASTSKPRCRAVSDGRTAAALACPASAPASSSARAASVAPFSAA